MGAESGGIWRCGGVHRHDHRALVCTFLFGGNDHANTLVPYDPGSYALYQGMRPTLAYESSALGATALVPSVALPGGHGWGGTHLVMGGAVQGGRYYGTAPETANNGADDAGQGRLLPSMSVDQCAATLGRWLGISDAALLTVLPNLGHWGVGDRGLCRGSQASICS